MKKSLRWLWFDFLAKPLPDLFRGPVYACIIFAFFYVTVGFSIISNPGFLLRRDSTKEFIAHGGLTRAGLGNLDVPRVYILPKDMRKTFLRPYLYLCYRVGIEESSTSFCWPDTNEIILQEDATVGDLFHEVGHIVDYQTNPEAYGKKCPRDKEFFAADFSVRIIRKFHP